MKKNHIIILLFVLLISNSCNKESSEAINSLTNMTIELPGSNCNNGGYKISVGLDVNSNLVLDENEIQSEEFVCNGINGNNGTNGTNGNNSLINVSEEQAGTYCSDGGIKIETGLDINSNGILDENEIQTINYICNGENGQNSGQINVVRIPFNLAYKWRSSSTYWSSEVEDGMLSDFNILNYQGFDSAIFIAQFHRQPQESTDTIWLRLFDHTDQVGIVNSELFSVIPNSELNDPDNRIFRSNDFKNLIPLGARTIGIQYKSELPSMSLSIHHAEVLLKKNQ